MDSSQWLNLDSCVLPNLKRCHVSIVSRVVCGSMVEASAEEYGSECDAIICNAALYASQILALCTPEISRI